MELIKQPDSYVDIWSDITAENNKHLFCGCDTSFLYLLFLYFH